MNCLIIASCAIGAALATRFASNRILLAPAHQQLVMSQECPVAVRNISIPQAACLCNSQSQTGHLAVFTTHTRVMSKSNKVGGIRN
jgi:hypothetical protein